MLHLRWSLLHVSVVIEKFYKQLEIHNLSTVSNVGKHISCPCVNGKLMHRCPKISFRQFFGLDLVFNLFSIFYQIPGSCSFEISLTKKSVTV